MIRFACPACSKSIQAPVASGGLSGPCPSCKTRIPIPRLTAVPSSDAEPRNGTGNGGAGDQDQVPEIVAKTASGKDIPPATAAMPSGGGASIAGAVAVSAPAPAPTVPPIPLIAQYLKFKCPNCEKPIGFPFTQAGRPSACPKCLTRIMIPEKEGEESFIIGALSPVHKTFVTARSPATPAVRLQPIRRAATRLRIAIKAMPWWKTTLTAVGCSAALVLAAILIVRELRQGLEARAQTDAQRDERGDTVAAASAQAASQTATQKVHAPVAANHAPGDVIRPMGVPKDGASTEAMEPVEITLRDETPAQTEPLKPTALFNLERKTPSAMGTDEDDKPLVPSQSILPVVPPPSPSGRPVEKPADPVLDLIEKNSAKDVPNQPPAVPEKVPEIVGIAPVGPVANPGPVDPPTVCADCMGVSFLRLPSYMPYLWNYKEPAPDPQIAVPFIHCPKCQQQMDLKALVTREAERMKTAPARAFEWPRKLNTDLECGETRFVSLVAQLSPATTRLVLQKMDKLTQFLQQNFRSALLTQTRPDRHELIILWDRAGYERLIDVLAAEQPGDDWDLTRRVSGNISRYRCFFNAQRGVGCPPEHAAVFQFAHMLIQEGTDGKSPDWLTEGFSTYCENTVLKSNLCYAFRYELNQVRLGANWSAEIARYARTGQLQPWDRIFKLDLIGMKALDYLTCYSVVRFLTCDPTRFNTLLVDLRAGVDSKRAIEHAYGRPIGELQQVWAQWALSQR